MRGVVMKYAQFKIVVVAICAAIILAPSYAASMDARQGMVIPSGTVIPVRMIDSIQSDRNRAGETFVGSLDAPVRVNNQTVLPRGSKAYVRLVSARTAGKLKGRSELRLQLDRVVTPSGTYVVQSNVVEFRGSSQGKKTGKSAGIGAAIGAGAGALLGGGSGALL